MKCDERSEGEVEDARIETARSKWTNRALYSAAALSFLAEAIHLWFLPEYHKEWLGYGVFFLAVAVFQGLLGATLLFRPRRWVFVLGILGNLAVVLLWAYTRIIAVPLGPMAGEAEGVGMLDLTSAAVEVTLAILLVSLWRRFHEPTSAPRRSRGRKSAAL